MIAKKKKKLEKPKKQQLRIGRYITAGMHYDPSRDIQGVFKEDKLDGTILVETEAGTYLCDKEDAVEVHYSTITRQSTKELIARVRHFLGFTSGSYKP